MINEILKLKECLILLNEMMKNSIDRDADSDGVLYILVDPKKIGCLRLLIPNEKDFRKYMRDYGEDWKEYGFDITGVWSEVCDKFDVDIWCSFKRDKFYIRRWYHVVDFETKRFFRRIKRNIEMKYKDLVITYRNWKYERNLAQKIKKQYGVK